jgi:phosphatidylserine/phosphatidylglycerophosphate/cardiolipin synthase-like enzyme
MARIISAKAWANNEIAYIAWDVDERIPGCLGFEVTRVYLDTKGKVVKREDGQEDRVKCAAWVSFKGQHNPDWINQDTGVWPVQKFSWRDLTLRKRRDGMTRRPDEVTVRFEIRPVGDFVEGMEPVDSNGREQVMIPQRDKKGGPILGDDGKPVKVRGKAYQGKPRALGYLAPAVETNPVVVTSRRPPFRTTFTNGILAAQWLSNVLNEDGVIEKNELIEKISNPGDPHRKYLAGDVLPLLHELFSRPGTFYLALYELEDEELEQLILANKDKVNIILANTSKGEDGKWDVRNEPARGRLRKALDKNRLQDRMFNNPIHIGHNKFVVHLDPEGTPQSVFTGSTNWTSTGVAGQTNNALLVEEPSVASVFLDYWMRMHDQDVLPKPEPKLSSPMSATQQGVAFRASNGSATVIPLAGGAEIQAWFSPNMEQRKKPASTSKPVPVPPDLQEVYRRMRMAKEAILFLAFYPGQKGVDCMIGEAIDIGRKDSGLIVQGAVSSAQAMPNYVAKQKDKDTGEIEEEGDSPTTFDEGNVSIVRAARIDEKTLLGDLHVEQLTAKGGIGAIIHDKIVVIDPLSPDCTVILGSHNLGFKASYSNDENMLIVTGHQELAVAYAVHVLDVYDHYRFRAIENELSRQGKKGASGFLRTDDSWQDHYVDGTKGAISRYFAR